MAQRGAEQVSVRLVSVLEFDGTNDYVDIDGYKGPAGSFSFSLWMNPDALSTAIDPVIGNYHTGNDEFYFAPEDDAEFFVRTSGTDGAIDSDAFTTNEWQHVVGVYDEENTEVRLYRNGILLGTGATTGTYDPSSTNDIRIGARASGSSFAYDGLLDDVRMYDYALSQADIMQLYNGGKPIAHYRLDEGAGVRVFDESGEGNHGTTTNMVVDNSNWVNGKFGKALDFDGSDDHVVVATNSVLELTDGTVSFWAKLNGSSDINYGVVGYRGSVANTRYSVHMNPNDDTIGLWNASTFGTVSTTIDPNIWYHVTLVESGSDATVYVNGVSVGTTGNAFSSVTGQPLYIGHAPGSSENFDGTIDDVRIYNYARTAVQVQQDYNNGLAARFGN